MFRRYTRLNNFCFTCLCLCVSVQLGIITYPVVTAQAEPAFARRVRNLETAPLGILHPAGLAFSPNGRHFQVIGSRQLTATATDLVQLTPVEQVIGSKRIAAKIDNPMNVTFDGKYNRLLILRDNAGQLIIVQADETGAPDPKSMRHSKLRALDLQNPQGLTVDPASGVLYILDAVGPRLVQVAPDAAGEFENAVITTSDLPGTLLVNPRGLAWNPGTGHLYLFSSTSQTLAEVTPTGQMVSTRDLAALGLSNPQAFVFAPSGDATDDPAALSLYIADAGQPIAAQSAAGTADLFCTTPDACPNTLYLPLIVGSLEQTTATGGETIASAVPANAGTIVEVSLAAPIAAAASSFTSALVRTVNLAAISPPSPDPSGLAYLPAGNTLLISDGEVEETVAGITHFRGANVWELTLSGSVVRTANISRIAPTVVPMTNEPTGTAWNPSNGHYYITDDDARRVYDLNPGADGLIGTADDTWSSFDTLAAGNNDPEGITFDWVNNQLFVADGLNMEIYRYTLSGALLGRFDVQQYGVLDPESVEFNPGSGTLLVLSNHESRIIIETTTSGALLGTFDISAASPYAPAGLAYAPASDGSGVKRFYVVDRRIDNDSDPNIVDGRLYELTAPQPAGNTAPVVSAGPDQSISLPSTATLDGTVIDDGLPTPPTLTTNWSQISGPGTVTFGNANAVDTTASFSTPGVYTLRLTASDGALSASDDVTITANFDLIFTDGFEAGNTTAWSSSTNAGSLSVTTAAALAGSIYGLRVAITSNTATYLTDLTPNAEPRYRARFYFDPNSIAMSSGNAHYLFYGYSDPSTVVLSVEFRRSNTRYQLRAGLLNDASTLTTTPWVTISDAPHVIELDWRRSTAAGANNGGLTFWIDNQQRANITGIDNDTRRIDTIQLGPVAGIDSGTRGAYYFDAFVSRRQSYIGP